MSAAAVCVSRAVRWPPAEKPITPIFRVLSPNSPPLSSLQQGQRGSRVGEGQFPCLRAGADTIEQDRRVVAELVEPLRDEVAFVVDGEDAVAAAGADQDGAQGRPRRSAGNSSSAGTLTL